MKRIYADFDLPDLSPLYDKGTLFGLWLVILPAAAIAVYGFFGIQLVKLNFRCLLRQAKSRMSMKKATPLKRPLNPMPARVRRALTEARLLEVYKARPPYQRNDYLWWISSPKLEATREKRLNQMLAELKKGDVYMGMSWRSKKK